MTADDTANLMSALQAKAAELDQAEAGGADVSAERLALQQLASDALTLGSDPTATHDQAVALTSQVNAVGQPFGNLFDGIGAFLAHPIATIENKLNPATPSTDYTPAAPTPTPADVAQNLATSATGALGSVESWLASAKPWAIGLAVLVGLALVAYVVSAVTSPFRALRT